MMPSINRRILVLLLGLSWTASRAQRVVFTPLKKTLYASLATVTTLAGTANSKGSVDAAGTAARLAYPMGIVVAADGMLYVVDDESHTIRKITPAGVVTTLAGAAGIPGAADGPSAAARFHHPVALALDAGGTLYVTDADNHTIRKITPAGEVTTLAGLARRHGGTDARGSLACFLFPTGVAVDAIGNVYVADHLNTTIRKISPSGEVSTRAGSVLRIGHVDGPGPDARFVGPFGIAVDADGTLYVTDGTTIRIIK